MSSSSRFTIGLRLESLPGFPLRRALAEAVRIGVAGVQIDAAGDLSPGRLSDSGRRELRTMLRTHDLELTALGCPLRRPLSDPEDQQPRLEKIRKVMSLAYDLGPRLVIIQAGQVPEKEDDPDARRMRESLADLAAYSDRVGTVLALETGLESGEALARYLGTFDTGSLKVNLDPANLLMNGFAPLASLRALAGLIAHVHARDCRKGSASRGVQEVPLGAGDIDWLSALEALEEADYRGWLVVEREQGDSRAADVAAGVAFLKRIAR